VHARRIGVVVPNTLWGRAIAKALSEEGIKSSLMVRYHTLVGDPRKREKSADLRAFTALQLIVDPTDAVAWRSWCGFGDYLMHSNHWCRLEDYAAEQGITVVEALEAIDGAPDAFLGADVLAQRYRDGLAMIQKTAGKRGYALLNTIADDPKAGLPKVFASMIEPVAGSESAAELLERARAHAQIRFADEDAVRIGLAPMMCGQEFDTVIWAGAIDGFYPSKDTFGEEMEEDRKAEVRDDQLRQLYVALACAQHHLIISCFQRDEVKSAAALGMQIRRIRDMDGEQMATLAPSMYIAQLGDVVPGVDRGL
jgi:DNA helicase-2/ATP-dependent DNA helicase PcrA